MDKYIFDGPMVFALIVITSMVGMGILFMLYRHITHRSRYVLRTGHGTTPAMRAALAVAILMAGICWIISAAVLMWYAFTYVV